MVVVPEYASVVQLPPGAAPGGGTAAPGGGTAVAIAMGTAVAIVGFFWVTRAGFLGFVFLYSGGKEGTS